MDLNQKFINFNRLIHKNSIRRFSPAVGVVMTLFIGVSALVLSQRLLNPVSDATRSQAAQEIYVDPKIAGAFSKDGKASVIVQFVTTNDTATLSKIEKDDNERRTIVKQKGDGLTAKVKDRGAKILRNYENLPYVVMEVTPVQFDHLKTLKGEVTHIYLNAEVTQELYEARLVVKANVFEGLPTGYNGDRSTVVVIDDGVDDTNTLLQGQVLPGACFGYCPNGAEGGTSGRNCERTNWTDINDGICEHGTGVASNIAARHVQYNGKDLAGIAPGAKIVPIRVVNRTCTNEADPNTCKYSLDHAGILAALDWVYTKRLNYYPIAAVNMSLSRNDTGPLENCDDISPFKNPIDLLASVNIPVVAATGNQGYTTGVGDPACLSKVVKVGATYKNDSFFILSNRSLALASSIFMSPGVDIVSAIHGNAVAPKTGSSLAAPQVAGALAILRQVGGPDSSYLDAVNALRSTATMIVDPVAPPAEGLPPGTGGTFARIDIEKAIGLIQGAGPTVSCASSSGTVTTCTGPAGNTTLGISDGQVLQANVGQYKNMALVTASYRAADPTTAQITSLTYCGASMTRVGGAAGRSKNGHQTTEMWYLVNPQAGTCNYIATFSANPQERVLSATVFNNVDSTNPIESVVTSSGAGTGIAGIYTQSKTGPKNSMMECILSSYPNGNANIPLLTSAKSRQFFTKEGPGKLITTNLGSSYQRTADNENMTLTWSTTQVQNFAMTCANIRLAAPLIPSPPSPPPPPVSPPPVSPPPPSVTTVNIKANNSDGPITIAYNKSVSLTWTSSNASSCTASNAWTGTKTTAGSFTTPLLTANKTYTITCTGSGGTKSDSVTVNVTKLPLVDLKINGSDTSVTFDKGIAPTLSWSQTGATSCTASGGWSGTKALAGGSEKGGVLGDSKSYTLVCTNASGSVSDTVSVVATANQAPVGYLEKYYTDTNMQQFFGQRVSTRIDYDWGTHSVPMPGMPGNYYSARYSAQITPSVTGKYTFITTSDDGVRLYIDDTSVINNWAYHGRTLDFGDINLVAGRQYDLVIEFVESSGGSTMVFQAGVNGGPAPINPKAVSLTLGSNGGGLTTEYFGNSTFTNPLAIVREPILENLWVTVPSSLLPFTYHAARMTGTMVPKVSATYTFVLSSGARMWVNEVLKTGAATDNGSTSTVTHSMTANTPYNIRIETGLGTFKYFFVRSKYGTQPLRPLDFNVLRPVPGSTAQQPSPPQALPPTQSGLKATYFDKRDLTGNSISRLDPYIQFYWSGAAPEKSIPANDFSARWSGTLVVPTAGSYTFYSEVDDGMRVTVDGQRIIDKWTWESHYGAEKASNPMTLSAGDHSILVEYNQGKGGAKAVLRWAGPGITKRVIPQVNYKSASSTVAGIRASYFNNEFFTGTSIDKTDPAINFNWERVSPTSGINVDRFSVRWTGIIKAPSAGSYIFYTEADDGIKVWIDGTLVNDYWWWQSHYGAEKASSSVNLSAGTHTIKVETHDGTGGAKAIVRWSGPNISKQILPVFVE